jgi:small nuclear ribonucleoprotein (snRNP)-like protein
MLHKEPNLKVSIGRTQLQVATKEGRAKWAVLQGFSGIFSG